MCVCVCVCVCVCLSGSPLWVQLCMTRSHRWQYGNPDTCILILLHRKLLFCLSVAAIFILRFIVISICCNNKCLISFTSLDTSCFYVCILRPGGSQKCIVLSLALKGPAESLCLSRSAKYFVWSHWRPKFIWIVYQNSVCISQKTHSVSIMNTGKLILYREIICVFW